jgi:hypothetical protein
MSSVTKSLHRFYMLLFVVMAITGLAQMPIFKRYYLADVPGLGWLAQFYVTHTIHYLGATALLALLCYFLADFFLNGKRGFRLTASARVRIVILGGIVMTGVFRVLKNLPDVAFSPAVTLFIDIAHLGFMMVYLFTALVCVMLGSCWLMKKAS